MHGPNPDDAQRCRELAIERYVLAYDRGDWDALAEVVEHALYDPELDRLLVEINAALYADTGLPSIDDSAETARALIRQYLPSGFTPEPSEEGPVTVDDVVQRLEGERLRAKPMESVDAEVNQRLAGNKSLLPVRITPDSLRELARQLGVVASDHYWELFRRAALTLRMSRESQRVSLAAARRQRSQRKGAIESSEDKE
jgi:hypothetical protein